MVATPSQDPPTDETSAARDAQLMRLATYAAVAMACLLIAAKSYAWWKTGSVSLLASLVDSLADVMASVLNLLAVRYALKPADRNHRFGHGKAESLAALMQAAFIMASCVFLVTEAVGRLRNPGDLPALDTGIAVMVLSIVGTGALVLFQRYVVRRTGSVAIRADSIHYRADLLGNLATLIALGLASQGLGRADPLFALAIALWLLISTREILRDAIDQLLDRELPQELRTRIVNLARAHPQVLNVHDVRTRRSGRTPIIQLHIELDGNLPLFEAHRYGDEVAEAIQSEIPGADVVIHQDPAGVDEQRRWTESNP